MSNSTYVAIINLMVSGSSIGSIFVNPDMPKYKGHEATNDALVAYCEARNLDALRKVFVGGLIDDIELYLPEDKQPQTSQSLI